MTAIVFKFAPNGAFVVGNRITGLTARVNAACERDERFEVLDWAKANPMACARSMLDSASYFKETAEVKAFHQENLDFLGITHTWAKVAA